MNRELASCVASILALSSLAAAQTLVRSISGPAAGELYGKACIRIGDQNGDGYNDYLVGAPGHNLQRGAIYCLSGAHLAIGAGNSTLWSAAPANTVGDLFGYALAEIDDITGDGVSDFLIGEPGYDTASLINAGAVRLVNGATHAVGPRVCGTNQRGMLGFAIDVYDPTSVVVSAPGEFAVSGYVVLALDAQFISAGTISTVVTITATGSFEIGTSISMCPDLDGDSHREIAIGLPGYANDSGAVEILSPYGAPGFIQYASSNPGERLGASVDARHDYDGDGVADIVAGAPEWRNANGKEDGRVVVLSGARLAAQTPPYEIHELIGPTSLTWDFHFGTAVRASGDLNNDGVGDIIVGAPDYSGGLSSIDRGFVSIFSGATAAKLATITGSNLDRVGDSITGAIQDLQGDGFKELLFAGWRSDAGGADSGVIKCYRLFPLLPATYCAGKLNSVGCTPSVNFTGSPSASAGAAFSITAVSFFNQKSGLMFYSHSPTGIAFQGGLKCVAQPSQRTAPQNSGGSLTGADCSGAYSFDFGALIQSGADASLVAGAEVFAQYWARDPQSPSTTSLSNALRFAINP